MTTPITDLIERMAAAGASIEVIVMAVRAVEEGTSKRRKSDSERQARKRASDRDLFDATTSCGDQEPIAEKESRDVTPESRDSTGDKKVSPIPPSKNLTSVVSKEETTEAACAAPVYTDSKHELWGEGVPILVQLGVPDRSARANIGRWLRDSRDDAASVLSAIQRARDQRVIDPVPWVTRALHSPNVVRLGRKNIRDEWRERMDDAVSQLKAFANGFDPDDPAGSGEVGQSHGRGIPYAKPS